MNAEQKQSQSGNRGTTMLGAGMAQNAAQNLGGRAYQLHVQEAKATGAQPLSPEQFAQQQRG